MREQIKRLIAENPNLSSTTLARFTGLSRHTISRMREPSNWTYSGVGLPFVCNVTTVDGVFKEVKFAGRHITRGSFAGAMESLDRLIFCLEHNNGKLPPTFEESIMANLGYLDDKVKETAGQQLHGGASAATS